jgi:hypothetical protein
MHLEAAGELPPEVAGFRDIAFEEQRAEEEASEWYALTRIVRRWTGRGR